MIVSRVGGLPDPGENVRMIVRARGADGGGQRLVTVQVRLAPMGGWRERLLTSTD